MIDHDRLFKELLTTFFVEFLELFFPEVIAYLQTDSLEFLDKEIFNDITSGEQYEADLIVKARFREQETFFLIHVENQAYSQADFGRRMFRYFARLFEKFALPVYPIVIFSFDAPRTPQPNIYRVEFPDKVVLEFNYAVVQLNRLNWRDFLRQENPVASALMAKMNIAPEERPKVKSECLRLLATSHLAPRKFDGIWSLSIKSQVLNEILPYKAAKTGRLVVKVNPAGTSQHCAVCLNRVPKELSDRWHECSCGASMPRDLNSGILIKKVGLGVRLTIKRESGLSRRRSLHLPDREV